MGEMSRHLIPHSRPFLGREEERAVVRALRSGMIGAGEAVSRFEGDFARFLGGGVAVAVQTGSAALHLALLSLGVGPGDRVVLPSYCCAAVLNAVRYCGAEPVLADPDPATANLDPAGVRRRLSARTRAVIVPHLFGLPAPVREIRRLGVPVVEDCAMSLGAEGGLLGDVSVFSFYATKMMATGHGGLVATRDRRRAAVARDLVDYDNRDDGRTRFNYRMSALAAALGTAQLRRLPGFVERRREIAARYRRALGWGGAPGGHAYYRFTVRVPDVERFARFMASRGVDCKRPVYRPLHRLLGLSPAGFPGAEELHRTLASVPLYPALRPAEVERVAAALRACVDGGGRIRT